MTNFLILLGVILLINHFSYVVAGTKSKPHSHKGLLQSYSGRHIPYKISIEDELKLQRGEPIIVNERTGQDGRGLVIQDIDASPLTCMDQIRNLGNYQKVVPKVKKVETYDLVKFDNGTESIGAEFSVGVALFKFNYFLRLTYEPAYYTVTWTLDYQYHSDFDDTTGHWQVMPHPSKSGWTRILYSTEVKLPPWVPEFVINMLTNSALLESTAWVKKESEKNDVASRGSRKYEWKLSDISSCFTTDDTGARFDAKCSERILNKESTVKSEL